VVSTADRLLYYARLAGMAMGWLWPTGFVFLGCHGVWLLVRDKSFSPDLVRFLGVILFVIISYAIPTLAPVHSTYFGYIFYGPAIVASLWSLAFLLRLLKVAPLAALLAGAVVFMLFWKPVPRYFDARNPAIVVTDEANRAVFPAISNLLSSTDPARTPLVMNISPGPVALHILEYFAILKGLSGTFDAIFNFESWEALIKKVESADVNVITETGALGQSPAHFPIYQYQDRLIKMFQSDPRWHVIATYTDPSGFRTFAFARAPNDPSRQSR
jgi:hypothetical protein